MPMLDSNTISQIKKQMDSLENPVEILFFKKKSGCETCEEIETFVSEIKSVSPKLSLNIYDIDVDKNKAAEFEIDMAPAIVLVGSKKRFVRFFGIPAGYEFSTFLSDIIDISTEKFNMPPDVIQSVKKIDFPVRLMVFVTPTCPYCPKAVKIAHSLALLNPMIKGDMIDVLEFPQLGEKYGVMGVPKTVINEIIELEGAYPLEIVLKKIQELRN